MSSYDPPVNEITLIGIITRIAVGGVDSRTRDREPPKKRMATEVAAVATAEPSMAGKSSAVPPPSRCRRNGQARAPQTSTIRAP